MDSFHCVGSEIRGDGLNLSQMRAGEREVPTMVMVGTASNAYTMKIGLPASVAGKKSPYPMVKKNLLSAFAKSMNRTHNKSKDNFHNPNPAISTFSNSERNRGLCTSTK